MLVLATLLVPGSVIIAPLFVLVSRMNLVDTYWAVILPAAAGPLGVFLMRQFASSIPDDLLEAGQGRRRQRVLHLPAHRAAPVGFGAGRLGILTFLPSWNALLRP